MKMTTPIGCLSFVFEGEKVREIAWGKASLKFVGRVKAQSTEPSSKQSRIVTQQLKAYFSGKTKTLELPYVFEGTDFQKRVWQALLKIPYGKTLTYQQLADQLKTGPRAVGNACRKNPLPLIIPCHRVVAKTGLGGFAGKTSGQMLAIKKALLELEGFLENL